MSTKARIEPVKYTFPTLRSAIAFARGFLSARVVVRQRKGEYVVCTAHRARLHGLRPLWKKY